MKPGKNEKLNYKQLFLIGFGFFSTSIAWSMYNANVPLILKNYVSSATLIGLIMSIDNIFAVIFQPIFGALSDKTRTRRGKRMPYILIGLPLCAVLFVFIPATSALWALMAVVICFNFIMSAWRAPVVALMPDVTPPALRSKGNGIINLMGGVGSIIAFLAGGTLLNHFGMEVPFAVTSAVMMLAWCCLFFFVKEPSLPSVTEKVRQKTEEPAEPADRPALSNKKSLNKSLLLILFAIFFWFAGYNAIETFFTTYATEVLGTSDGDASIILAFFSVTLVAAAIPAGIVGTKIGRRRTILIGIVGLLIVFPVMYLIGDVTAAKILMLFGGAFWAFININSLPMVVEIGNDSIGKYTGYYYFFSASAAIVSPSLFGFIKDITQNFNSLFVYSAVCFAAALICMLLVRHGEAEKPAPAEEPEFAE